MQNPLCNLDCLGPSDCVLGTCTQKKNKRFFGIHEGIEGSHCQKVYLVYTFDPVHCKIVSDRPYRTPTAAKEAMEGYLSKGLCAWITTYNE